MPNIKPYLTTDDLVEAVKLTMSFPLSQNSFTYNDIITFLNQELQLNAVPTLMEEHQEYLVYRKTVPLLTNISRYTIPDRAIGMSLRDVKFADSGGNYYDITRIAPDDKAFFQQSNGSNQTIGKFYLEGNELVLTPKLLANPTGNLVLFYFLRPNYLVRNNRACIIQHFHKDLKIADNSKIYTGDEIIITLNNQTVNPIEIIVTAVSPPPSVYSIDTYGVVTLNSAHKIPVGNTMDIKFSGINNISPDINGETLTVKSLSSNTVQIQNKDIVINNPTYTFTITSASVTAGATYKDINNNVYTVKNTTVSSTTLIVTGSADPAPLSGTLTKLDGTGPATITYSSYTSSSYNAFVFSLTTAANATAGDIYKNDNNEYFTVVNTISGSTSLFVTGTVNTQSSGILTRQSGSGTLTINYGSVTPVAITTGNYIYTVENQFVIDATANLTSINLENTVNAIQINNPEIKNLNILPSSNLADGLSADAVTNALGSFVQFSYLDISSTFEVLNNEGFELDNSIIEIQFDQLPTSYTDPETDKKSDLYTNGCLVDFLQTNAGHRTYTYDIKLISIVQNTTRGKFYVDQLKEYPSNSVGGVLEFYPIKVGDYICLQNECIIPQIPPELHHALAERAASRVLMAIGDKEGYAISLNKIKEMDDKQSTLIGSRVESSVPKVFNRYSLLRLGKSRFRRRY